MPFLFRQQRRGLKRPGYQEDKPTKGAEKRNVLQGGKSDTIYRVPTNTLCFSVSLNLWDTFFSSLRVFVPLCLCVMFFASPVFAQDAPPLPNPTAAFVAYQCNFQAATNSADINAVLMGSDGRP